MARPNNAPMGAWFKKMNKDSLIRLLVDEIKKNTKLEEENIELKNRLDAYELALDIWSKWQSELLVWKNYKPWFKNWMPTYDDSELNFI